MAAQDESAIKFRHRARLLVFFSTFWIVVAAVRLFSFSYINRYEYIRRGRALAMRKCYYSAGRGRILDKNGVPLAWSERYFDLVLLTRPQLPKYRRLLDRKLENLLPGARSCSKVSDRSVIFYNIPPHKIIALDRLVHEFPELKIIPRIERVVVAQPAVRRLIGTVKMHNGMLHGQSGLELKYDNILAGELGCYTIMLDRHKNFIDGSWHLTRQAVPGRDVTLKQSCQEITGK